MLSASTFNLKSHSTFNQGGTLIFGVEVPDSHGVVIAGGEEVVVFGVDHEIGDAVSVSLEHFDDPVLVDGPV
jgi:hypothetical protein